MPIHHHVHANLTVQLQKHHDRIFKRANNKQLHKLIHACSMLLQMHGKATTWVQTMTDDGIKTVDPKSRISEFPSLDVEPLGLELGLLAYANVVQEFNVDSMEVGRLAFPLSLTLVCCAYII
jgi:hypothetical protein